MLFRSNEHEYTAEIHHFLAKCYEKRKDFELANEFYQKAMRSNTAKIDDSKRNFSSNDLKSIKDMRKPIQFLSSFVDKSKLLYKLNKKELAMKHAIAGIDYVKSIENSYYSESSKFILNTVTSDLYDIKMEILSEKYDITNNDDYLVQMLEIINDAKSSSLIDDINLKRHIQKNPNLLKEWALIRDISKTMIDSDNRLRDITDIKAKHIDKVEKFKKKVKFKREAVNLVAINKSLKTNTLIIDYFKSNCKIYIFTIRKNSEFKYPTIKLYQSDLTQNLSELIQNYTINIKKMNDVELRKNGQSISEKLLMPFKSDLAGIDHLIILPHQNISRIPFSALPLNNAFLIENYSISNHYSLSLIEKRNYTKKNNKTYTAFTAFAPVFENSKQTLSDYNRSFESDNDISRSSNYKSIYNERGYLAPLKESYNEVTQISELFKSYGKKTNVFAFENANEVNLKKTASNSKILHISSHSFYNEIDHNKSAIFFAKTDNEKEDDILFSNESYLLDLQADLLVLSSCESAKGKLIANEGMLSLSRGFYYAGANNILSSLWKVSDKKTKILMVSFYKYFLNDNLSYSKALRLAQLDMIANSKNSSPKYWSSFILIGN